MNLFQTFLMISTNIAAMWLALYRRERLIPQKTFFIVYLCAGVLNEVVSMITSRLLQNTAYNNNVFMLLECVLLTLQFKMWSSVVRPAIWYSFIGLFVILFTAEMYATGFAVPSFYFNICYCFFLCLCATAKLAERINDLKKDILRDTGFLICLGILLYFFSRLFLESCWYYGSMQTAYFRNAVVVLMAVINFFVNLLYLLSVLWTAKKPGFISV